MRMKTSKNIHHSAASDRGSVIFVGNDINNTVAGNSWGDLVAHLIKFVDADDEIAPSSDSFPLTYEQIYLAGLRSGKVKRGEGALKDELAEWASRIVPNNLHREILALGIEHLITPNYDFALEAAAKVTVRSSSDSEFRERRYSLFRQHRAGQHTIWHIHGDVYSPDSLNLGYEQYSGYLQILRDYVVTGKIRKSSQRPLNVRLKAEPFEVLSWVDLMFTKDVFIFGFRLDQVEIHLWWLLDYRARKIAEGLLESPNRISYFYPKALLDPKCSTRGQTERRLAMLRAFGVDIVGLKGSPGTVSYYEEVLKKIK